MTKQDRIVNYLLNALDLIMREADKSDASRHYIDGVARQAVANCHAAMERNSDGYRVVKG